MEFQQKHLFTEQHNPSPPVEVDNTRSGGTIDPSDLAKMTWLTYKQASEYTGWSVRHLRNMVSAGQIPVYGRPHVRRFRRDMLDLFLTDPDAAMRKFRLERN